MEYQRLKSMRLTLGVAGVGVLGILALSVYAPQGREHGTERLLPLSGPSTARTEPLRSLPFESLSEMSFDDSLTLLGSEVERFSREPGAWSRIEQVAARLKLLHRENLKLIEKASIYYDSRSSEVQARFAAFRAEYQHRYESLQERLDALQGGDPAAGPGIVKLLRESGALQPPRQVPAAKDLPRRRLPAEHREPRMTPAEWNVGRKVGMAGRGAGGDLWSFLLGSRSAHAQEAEDDLAETPEVQFRPERASEIQKLLDDEDLRGHPAKIVNWVRNNIEFVPIWGGLQSSVTCLKNRKGTAMDIASLTIALLRASGIRARYQAGTVRMPIEEAMNWLGNFESAVAASSLLSSGGIASAVQVDETGKPVALRFEHVWVRAYVDYIPYQGACHQEGDTWLDLDASVKTYRYFQPPDVTEFLCWSRQGKDARAFAEEYRDSCSLNPATGEFHCNASLLDSCFATDLDRLVERLKQAAPNQSLTTTLGLGRVELSVSAVLSASTPFEVLARGWERAQLAEVERFGVEISLCQNGRPLLRFESSTADLGLSRLSLHFRPQSDADRSIIADQIPNHPGAYLADSIYIAGVRLVPELRRNADEVAIAGDAVEMGAPLDLLIDYREPAIETPAVRIRVVAGQFTAIGLDMVAVFPSPLQDLTSALGELTLKLESGDEGWSLEALLDVLLSTMVHEWFGAVDAVSELTASALDCVAHRYPSAGVCTLKWETDTLFGLPLSGSHRGITMDIPGDVALLLSRRGDTRAMALLNMYLGFTGSALEAAIPSHVLSFDTEHTYWLSSNSALKIAAGLGGSLYILDGEKRAVVDTLGLGTTEKEEIREALDRGLVAIAHGDPLVGDGTSYAGYALVDPLTGNGLYRMSSGANGADPVKCLLKDKPPPPPHSPVYNLNRVWQTAYKENAERYFRERVAANATTPSAAVELVAELNNGLKFLENDYKLLDNELKPYAQLVVLLAAVKVLREKAETEFSFAVNPTWVGVSTQLNVNVGTEAAVLLGEQIPERCLQLKSKS